MVNMSNSTNSPPPLRTLSIEEGKDYLVEQGDLIPLEPMKRLGHGHSGYVEEVRDTSTGSTYARKTIQIYTSRHREERHKIFQNEVKILRSLARHHHFVRVIATFTEKRQLSLVLHPVADSGDLNSFLEDMRDTNDMSKAHDVDPEKFKVLQRAFGCLASGLAFMHQFKVRHKDIKPQNILVHEGQVLYTDFGYSKDSSELRCVYVEILSVMHPRFDATRDFCFGRDVSRLHLILDARDIEEVPSLGSDLSMLAELCISMTKLEPQTRLTASQVTSNLGKLAGYRCERCTQPLPTNDASLSVTTQTTDLVSTHSSHSSRWTWDPNHRDYYFATQDLHGNWVYHWQNQQGRTPQDVYYLTQDKTDKNVYYGSRQTTEQNPIPNTEQYGYPSNVHNTYSTQHPYSTQSPYSTQPPYSQQSYGPQSHMDSYPSGATMPDPLPYELRAQLPDLIEGTPARGWREPLDPTYCMRTGDEVRQFFRIGRVFSMLYSEPASEQLARRDNNDDEAITVVRFNQSVYSQIRRFVIVEVRRGFVFTCAVSTYSGRGVLKPGCLPAEHTIIYAQGSLPTYLEGEYEAGMTKNPIEVIPADSSVSIVHTSRLRLGKIYPVEWNVKVKDIGQVHPEHLSKLIMYYTEEMSKSTDKRGETESQANMNITAAE